MIGRWSSWKPLPNSRRSMRIEAPIGPGVYEVCRANNGELVAFGHADNLERALAKIARRSRLQSWLSFGRSDAAGALEFRACTAGSAAEAETVVEHLLGRRSAMLRNFSWALRQ
jgi:hypothetical protein